VKLPDAPVTITLPAHLQGVCRLPAVRRHHGPLRPTAHQRERLRVRRAIEALYAEGEPDFAWWDPTQHKELVERCFAQFAECLHDWANASEPTVVDFHNKFFNLFQQMHIPEFQAARVFIFWIETAFQDIHPTFDIDLYELLEESRMTMLEDLHTWQLRLRMTSLQKQWERLEAGEPRAPRPIKSASQPIQRRHPIPSKFAALHADEAQRRTWFALQHPRVERALCGKPYYIIHLYSGRRREGDFHHYMQQFINQGPSNIAGAVVVISIDTAISDKMNIHSAALWKFLELISGNGQVLAFLLGPPCETWSSARFEIQYDEDGTPLPGPRPLRGDQDCWGLLNLSFKELQQVAIGNELLLRGLLLCAPVALHGGATTLEHPAPPLQEERPSIWRTGILKLLSSGGRLFRHYTFQQWKHGAEGIKPTTLLYSHAPIPATFASNEQMDLIKPVVPLIGRGSDGRFRTARAKEYPPGMNRCLAEAFWSSISTCLAEVDEAAQYLIPPLARELADLSACVEHGQTMMADYQPV